MIYFPPLRTRRLTVQLHELTIGDSLALAVMPPHLEESARTAFLRCAVDSVQGIDDPANWTVQEQILAVCHYLAATADDGPDFSVGNDGRYSDYLQGEADIQVSAQTIELGEIEGDVWHIRHLTGAMAESIERLEGEINGLSGRLHWIFCAMAAQLVLAGEDAPDAADGKSLFDEHLLKRVQIIRGYGDSDFAKLFSLYHAGREKLHHLFRIEFTDDGIVVMPKGGAAGNLPPARFPVHTCLSRLASELVGKPKGPSFQSDHIFEHVNQ